VCWEQAQLKDQAQAWAGNYAIEEIKDITKIPVEKLLQYNLIDAMSTWYVYEKHWNTLVADEQLEIYETLFKPATVDIIQMQLTGLPVNMERVTQVEAEMLADEDKALTAIRGLPLVQKFEYLLNEDWVNWKNSTLKKKRVSMADAKEVFNPNSPPQLQRLLYEELALPVIATTDSKLLQQMGIRWWPCRTIQQTRRFSASWQTYVTTRPSTRS